MRSEEAREGMEKTNIKTETELLNHLGGHFLLHPIIQVLFFLLTNLTKH